MIEVERISADQSQKIIHIEEGQFSDVKSIEIAPAKLTKTISAFANSDGGDIYIGISETGISKTRSWEGFSDQEAANGHVQIFEQLFPLGNEFQYEFLKSDFFPGLVLHLQVSKTLQIIRASNEMPYVRRGAMSLPIDTPEKLKRLEYSKGVASYEIEVTNTDKELVTESDVIEEFIGEVVPSVSPERWL
ncbi:MAG: ATP-binding protein, partial [Armatimonadota bacterium]